ncbi:MAG: DnaJ domain-containing protein [Syntrophobacteraceae bacterium]|jgi:DnaJ-class molecular chaperone|nr:DnaJ domain-containing protein [Syntrophobacteraceae bacterium]
MGKRDHYEILGVERTEAGSGIKTAFRQLAKRYHPDLSGPEATRRFQEILEAYEVLSDPESRASYNQGLRARDASVAASRPGAGHSEPMEDTAAVRSPRPRFSMGTGGPWSSLFADEVFDLFFGSFPVAGHGRRGFQRRRALNAEVVLSGEEAGRGGVLPLRHPGLLRCGFCGGVGLDEFLVCGSCHARGAADGSEVFPVRIPAGIQDGSTLDHAVESLDGSVVLLRVHIRVRDG